RVTSAAAKERLKAKWAAMSQEEREAYTAERVVELEERRENRHHGVRNLALAKFIDVREMFSSLHTQLYNVRNRTGVEIFLAAVRAEHTAYNKPVIYYSSNRVRQFIEMVTNASLAETGVRMEAYCIGGAEGMSQCSGPYQAEYVIYLLMVSVSQKLTTLVVTTEDACKCGVIKRMFYDTFDQQITIKHGVVLENWPNAKFHSLSNMMFLEAEICLASFENNTTRFRSLPDREWATW
ncbi:hypothetical protein K466DRAFT_447984, partial [Polyporus arcularius HHB13444]